MILHCIMGLLAIGAQFALAAGMSEPLRSIYMSMTKVNAAFLVGVLLIVGAGNFAP